MRIVIIILFLFPASLFGQGFGGGLFGGISTTQITGDNIGGFNKVGGWGGAFTDYRFTPRSTLQFELSFIQKGSRQAGTVDNGNEFYLYNLNMLEIPVMYRWYGIKNMSIEGGLQAGILLGSFEIGPDFPESRDPSVYHRAEWSWAAGLSYYFWKSKIEANARYSHSILSMRKGDWWVNHIIAFSVRYWFKTTLDKDRINATKKKNKVQLKIDTGEE